MRENWAPPLGSGRQVFCEAINDQSAGRFVQDLMTWMHNSQQANTLVIYLNSIGGNVPDALAMRGAIGMLRRVGHKVVIVVLGRAASCAMLVAQAADEVYIDENAWMMTHRVKSRADGDSVDLAAEGDFVKLLQEQSFALTATQKWTPLQIAARVREEGNVWLNANQCLELGLVNGILMEPKIYCRSSSAS
jgi:ATP-dependent protease ClpP protease subunit